MGVTTVSEREVSRNSRLMATDDRGKYLYYHLPTRGVLVGENSDSGSQWRVVVGSDIHTLAVMNEGSIVCAVDVDGTVRAFSEKGNELWMVDIGRPMNRVVSTGKLLLVALDDAEGAVLVDATGRLFHLDGYHMRGVIDGAVDVAAISADGEILALSTETGRLIVGNRTNPSFIRELESPVTDIRISGQRLLVMTLDGRCVVFDRSGRALMVERNSGPVVGDISGTGVAIARPGGMVMLYSDLGMHEWTVEVDRGVVEILRDRGSGTYVLTDLGKRLVYIDGDGLIRWQRRVAQTRLAPSSHARNQYPGLPCSGSVPSLSLIGNDDVLQIPQTRGKLLHLANTVRTRDWLTELGFPRKVSDRSLVELMSIRERYTRMKADTTLEDRIEELREKEDDLSFAVEELEGIIRKCGSLEKTAKDRLERYASIRYAIEKEILMLEALLDEREERVEELAATAKIIALEDSIGSSTEGILEAMDARQKEWMDVQQTAERYVSTILQDVQVGRPPAEVLSRLMSIRPKAVEERMRRILKVKGFSPDETELIVNDGYTEDAVVSMRDVGKAPPVPVIHLNGEFINGSRVTVTDSVVIRSNIDAGPGNVELSDGPGHTSRQDQGMQVVQEVAVEQSGICNVDPSRTPLDDDRLMNAGYEELVMFCEERGLSSIGDESELRERLSWYEHLDEWIEAMRVAKEIRSPSLQFADL